MLPAVWRHGASARAFVPYLALNCDWDAMLRIPAAQSLEHEGYRQIIRDMLKTRNRESILFEACIRAKQPLVIDNTNPTVKERVRYIQVAKEAGFKIAGYYFNSVIVDAVSKNRERCGKECIPVPAILGTYKKLELPHISEGFNELWYVRMDGNNGFLIEEYNVADNITR